LNCCGDDLFEDSPFEWPKELTCDDNNDNDCDGLIDLADPDCPKNCTDNDGDGYNQSNPVECGILDCDDTNASIYPGAPEICNGVDDDCNGTIDDGFDKDGDNYTTCGGDCDDTNASIHPGAIEICNGLDDDCNGIVDDGFDIDADGWTTCNEDCDDYDRFINPGATEVCDLRDNDCDGLIDEGFDQDNDGWSTCQGDCNDTDDTTYPGAPEICDGKDNQCPPGCFIVDYLNIGNPIDEADNSMQGWGPIQPNASGGNWGGADDGTIRGAWFGTEGNSESWGSFTMQSLMPVCSMEVNALDGIANGTGNDDFDVFVRNSSSEIWMRVYNHTGTGATSGEAWIRHGVDLFNTGVSDTVYVMINNTAGGKWGSFNKYGQLGISRVWLNQTINDSGYGQIDEGFDPDICNNTCVYLGYNLTNNTGNLSCCGDDLGEDDPFEWPIELTCNDTHDNDCDGFVDILDSDCVYCGNGVIDAGEYCDSSDLNNETCISLGYDQGTLKCTVNCTFTGCSNKGTGFL